MCVSWSLLPGTLPIATTHHVGTTQPAVDPEAHTSSLEHTPPPHHRLRGAVIMCVVSFGALLPFKNIKTEAGTVCSPVGRLSAYSRGQGKRIEN